MAKSAARIFGDVDSNKDSDTDSDIGFGIDFDLNHTEGKK